MGSTHGTFPRLRDVGCDDVPCGYAGLLSTAGGIAQDVERPLRWIRVSKRHPHGVGRIACCVCCVLDPCGSIGAPAERESVPVKCECLFHESGIWPLFPSSALVSEREAADLSQYRIGEGCGCAIAD